MTMTEEQLRGYAVRLQKLFRGNATHHYTADFLNAQRNKDGKLVPVYTACHGAPPLEAFERHLRGERGLLVVPIMENDRCWWGAIDIDAYPTDILALKRQTAAKGLPLVASPTKSQGAHLFYFPRAERQSSEVRSSLATWAAELGQTKVEIFPKQDSLPAGQQGSGINLPCFGGVGIAEFLAEVENAPAARVQKAGISDIQAAAEILSPHWTEGQRDNLNFAVLGALLRHDVDEAAAQELVDQVAALAGDNEYRRRAEDVARELQTPGKRIPGYPRLVELIGRADAQQLLKLMGGEAPAETLIGPAGALATAEQLNGTPYRVPTLVPKYLLQDAGATVGPGGSGKSTLLLYEAVMLALGRALYGRELLRPGPTLVVTAEDDQAVVFGRLNEICTAMHLTPAEREQVRTAIHVEDIAASFTRLVTADKHGACAPHCAAGRAGRKICRARVDATGARPDLAARPRRAKRQRRAGGIDAVRAGAREASACRCAAGASRFASGLPRRHRRLICRARWDRVRGWLPLSTSTRHGARAANRVRQGVWRVAVAARDHRRGNCIWALLGFAGA
ncbi:MAG TPA: AAA family ATPase [Steroidobacteraceae bacterium]|nr:AAA family ATPase [Steroidobacteraceae bacterium]